MDGSQNNYAACEEPDQRKRKSTSCVILFVKSSREDKLIHRDRKQIVAGGGGGFQGCRKENVGDACYPDGGNASLGVDTCLGPLLLPSPHPGPSRSGPGARWFLCPCGLPPGHPTDRVVIRQKAIVRSRVPCMGPISTPSYSQGPDSNAKPNGHCPLATPLAKYVCTQTRATASPAGQGGWAPSRPLSLSCRDGTIWLTGRGCPCPVRSRTHPALI